MALHSWLTPLWLHSGNTNNILLTFWQVTVCGITLLMRTVPGNDNVSKLVQTLCTAGLPLVPVPQMEVLTLVPGFKLQLHSRDLGVGFTSMISESSVFVCVMYDYELGRWTWVSMCTSGGSCMPVCHCWCHFVYVWGLGWGAICICVFDFEHLQLNKQVVKVYLVQVFDNWMKFFSFIFSKKSTFN